MDGRGTVDPGPRGYSVDPDALAEDTDRSGYDPYEGHPARGGAEPGQQEETDYWTELSHGDA